MKPSRLTSSNAQNGRLAALNGPDEIESRPSEGKSLTGRHNPVSYAVVLVAQRLESGLPELDRPIHLQLRPLVVLPLCRGDAFLGRYSMFWYDSLESKGMEHFSRCIAQIRPRPETQLRCQ